MVCVSEVTSSSAVTSSLQFTSVQSVVTNRPLYVSRHSDPHPYSGSVGGQAAFRPPRMPPSTTTNSFRMPSGALVTTVSVTQRSSDAVAAGLALLRGSAVQPVPQPAQTFGLYRFSRHSN